MAKTVWYDLGSNQILIKEKNYAEPESYTIIHSGVPIEVQNHLGLMAFEIDKKNWAQAIKDGFVIKLGNL